MNATGRRFVFAMACAILAASVLGSGGARAEAMGQGPTVPPCTDNSRVFWFVHASDTHVGTSGTNDTSRLDWLVTTARIVIQPLFTVVTGDLTDSTNGNIFGYPNGPYLSEWQQYRGILDAAGVTAEDYYDIPGNHDAYSDAAFEYFGAWGLQGPALEANRQVAWTKTTAWGERYHFVAVNTADNSGDPFSLAAPYGDYAGLDAGELDALGADLAAEAATASLSFVFGHHPVAGTGSSTDTYLYYGAPQFVTALGNSGVLAYNYGHVHDNVETIFKTSTNTGTVPGAGLRYRRVASLAKSSGDLYSLVSVDCNGVNAVTQPVGTWPLVLVTAPVGRYAGSVENPYAYDVDAGTATPIRALVFDQGTVERVQFRVDGGTTWYPMTRTAGTPKWWGTWNSSIVAAGEHTLEVQATGTTVRSHSVKVNVVGSNPPPPPPPVTDTVAITTATYTRKTSTLLVKATSTGAPAAVLTVQGYGQMAYSAKTKRYTFQGKVSPAPSSVTVTSDQGGAASRTVTTK